MFPNVNPKQMGKLMAQMGIKSEEIDAERVVIEKRDGSKIIVKNPSVTKVSMKGQSPTLQVAGEITEEAGGEGGDAEIVAKETGCTIEQAEKALKESGGDLAQAIIKVQGG
ncbi:hypothetical protein AUJ15_02390 [Candidatus Micrarchaeota archaeon CG1_02_55_41]|nr:MAG: hypothetical protein AUJ15_02390 [Candidatus Micrarchaeota archaeon CG1_02_55_41]